MIAIIDYGVGNLFSLSHSLQAVGAEARVTGEAEVIARADHVILPGVGAFGDAAAKLREAGLDALVRRLAAEGMPIMGICLGSAFAEALGDMGGIQRYGSLILPMDEALILSAVDISGRDYLGYDLTFPTEKIGAFDTQLVQEFWLGFVRKANVTLHLRKLAGVNSHHIAEGAFKAAGRALRAACAIDPALAGEIPSTKGVL